MTRQRKIKPEQRMSKAHINSSWFTNVAKSMGFAAGDLVKDLTPNTSDFLSYNSSDSIDMIRDIRRQTGVRTNLTKQLQSIPQISVAKDALQNALDDIKSGKIINNDRATQFDDEDLDFGYGLFDDGDSISFSDDGNSADNSDNVSPNDVTVNKNTVNNVIDTLPLAKTIASGNEATLNAMSAIADQNMAVESEKMMFNHKATTSILGGLNAINDNLSTLVKFHGDSTAKYYAASIKYYEESLEQLKTMHKSQEDRFADQAVDTTKSAFEDSMYTHTGGLKIGAYGKRVKQNLSDIKDDNAMLSGAFDMFTDVGNLKALAKNPMGTMIKLGMRTMVPAATRVAVNAVDKSLSSIIPALLGKVNGMEDDTNPVFNYLNKVFGAKNKLSYDVDLGEYNKGSISWDGESKKALVEVIPAHLRRIEAALTGKSERTYDYSTGKFSSFDDIKKNYHEKLSEVEGSGYMEARTKMREIATEMRLNKKTMDQFEKDMKEYFSAITKKGSMINPFIKTESDGTEVDDLFNNGLFDGDTSRINLMRQAFKGLNIKDLVNVSTTNIHDSRQKTQAYMDEIRKNPNLSGYGMMNNNGTVDKDGKLIYDPSKSKVSATDKFGLNQLDYLRDIRKLLINGITVFPDKQKRYKGWKANSDAANRQSHEESEYIRRLTDRSGRDSNNEYTIDESDRRGYEDVENLSNDELSAIYANATSGGPKRDNKIARKIAGKTHKLNDYVGTASSLLDNQIYRLMFGDDIDRQLKSEADKRKLMDASVGGRNTVGGLLGKSKNFFQDTFKGIGAYFTGQSYTKSDGTFVPEDPDSMLKKMKSFFTGTNEKLFGERGNDEDNGLISKVSHDFMDGYKQFKTGLFGETGIGSKEQKETLKELTGKVKSRLPKAIGAGIASTVVKSTLASHMGLLGSIILPGGPLGAAITGTTLGFLSQSETFQKWLFGEKDSEGERMGGLIPKSLTDSIKAHGGTLKTGAMVGGVAGLLPSFFLPGGPVTGAILGMGTSMLAKSDNFQEMLYGEDFKNGDKKSIKNGKFGKLFKKTLGENANPKLATFLGTAGVGLGLAQGVGLLPSFLLPGGPIIGSMLGLAGGIAASSDKFQKILFGDKEVDGSRYGGLMTKMTNWFDTTIVSPMKIKASETNDAIYDFINTKMINPLVDAFAPLTTAVKFAVDDAKENAKNVWKNLTDGMVGAFNDNVVKPFGESLEKYIVDPMKEKMNKILSLMGKALGSIISSPFKLISGLGNMADKHNGRRVLKQERQNRRDGFKNMLSEKWSDGSLTARDVFGGLRDQFMSKSEKNNILDNALPYRRERETKREERKAAHEAKMAERRSKREEMQAQFEEDKKFGKESNWKFASKKQKQRHEDTVKQKAQWMQEQLVQQGDETVAKLSSIDEVISKIPDYQKDALDALKSIKDSLNETLRQLTHRGYGNNSGDGDGSNILNTVTDALRNQGQSHADGLDNVPKDGYLAELHEGEMVVPKKGAGKLRSLFGKDENGKNSIVEGISNKLFGDDEKDGVLGKMFKKVVSKDRKDRRDNPLNLSKDEQDAMRESQDIERKKYASRKNADFVQNKMYFKKKDKEERKFREDILAAISKGNDMAEKAGSFWDKIFGNGGILGAAMKGITHLLGSIVSKLGLGGALGLGAAALGANWLQDKQKTAEEKGLSMSEAMSGVGDEGQLNKDGLYARDNTGDNMIKTGARLAINPKIQQKYMKPFVDSAKTVHGAAKTGVRTAKDGIKAFDNYANPKITGKTVLGDTYEYSSKDLRQGMQKPAGAVSDFGKTVSKKSKDTVGAMCDMTRAAITKIESQLAKKFPAVKGMSASCDKILKSLLQNSDEVMKKFGKKIELFVVDVAADLIPVVGQVTEGLITAWDVATGLTKGNAASLFQVSQTDVDLTMRGITSVMQGVCKFSFFQIIWLVNEICSSMMDLSFLTYVARTAYSMVPIGKKKDMSNDLSGKDIDKMSVDDAIRAAGGDPKQFKGKNWNKLKSGELDGVSAVELQELKRRKYNVDNNTHMDKQGYNDEVNKTVGQKILGSKFVKNFNGTFKSSSVRGHLGLDKDAKLSFDERASFAVNKSALNVENFFRKLVGKKEISATDRFQSNDYDERGFRVGRGKGTMNYAQSRSAKEKTKIDDSNAEINKRLKAGEKKSGIGKWWNNMMIGVEKGKREKARDRLGSKEAETKATEFKDRTDKAKAESSKENAKKTIAKGGTVAAASAGASTAVKTATNAENKAAGTVKRTQVNTEKSINKIEKSNQKASSTLTRGMEKTNNTISKSLNNTNSVLSKNSKSTSKSIDTETRKKSKELDKSNKSLTKSVQHSFDTLKKKTDEMVKGISKVKVTSVKAITPTFTVDDPTKLLKDIINDLTDKIEPKKEPKKETKKKPDKKHNAGSSGITKSEAPKITTPKHNISSSDFISPSSNTTNNNNTNSTSNKFVFYNQADSRWSDASIGDNSMKDAGCGPTSLAMTISQLTGNKVTPDTIAELGQEHLPGYSTYSLFPTIANKFNMNYEESKSSSDSDFIVSKLKQGLPVILSGRSNNASGPYTNEGHVVTATDIKGDQVFVQDPRGKDFSGYFPIKSLMSGLNKGMSLTPSSRTNLNTSQAGQINGWNRNFNPNISKNPLGIYGDGDSLPSKTNMGRSGGGQVRVADKVLSYARAFLKQTSKFKYSQPEREGINHDKNTADCSSFVGHVLSVAGDTPVKGTSQSMWDSVGTKVSDPQIGDIVCQQGHVGLYSGDGNYIHMANSKDGIKESKAESKYNNPHRGYKRAIGNPGSNADAVIQGGNKLLGTVTATSSGNPLEGGAAPAATGSGSGGAVDPLGAFGQINKIGQNMMASIFNGKQVDLFASENGSGGDTSGTPAAATWNGTQYDLSKYNMTDLSEGKQRHIMNMINPTLETYKTHGLFPSVTIAQSVKEQGWNSTAPIVAQHHNMFGIKAGKSWNGKVFSTKTKEEYSPGQMTTITDGFRSYPSLGDGIVDRANFLSADRYVKAGVLSAQTPEDQVKALKAAGYATDSRYVNGILEILHQNNLARFDTPRPPVPKNSANATAGMGGEIGPDGVMYSEGIEEPIDAMNMGGAGTATSAQQAPTDGSIPDSMNGWAYYSQYDPRWNTQGVGGSTVKAGGCGPTSHAMMLTTMFGKKINPYTMTKWGHKNGTWNGAMQWSMPSKVAQTFGLSQPKTISGKSSSSLEAVKAELKAGRPVVMSGRTTDDKNTPFTKGGHIVLAVGVDGNNNVIINDPRNPGQTRAYTDAQLQLGTGLRQSWSFAKTNNSAIPTDFTVDGDFVPGAGTAATGTEGGGEAASVDPLGAFGQLSKIGQNMMASIFNGKQVDLFASEGGSTGGTGLPSSANDYVGIISAKYETGKEGGDPGMVSSGANDPLGGISYGIPQFSTKQGSADSFARWIVSNYPDYGKYFQGKKAGTSAFGDAWKQAAAEKGWEFGSIQVAKAHEDYYEPHVKRLQAKGINPNNSRGMQEAVYSTGVQHGGAGSSFNKYMGDLTSGMSPASMIDKIYKNRIAKASVKTTSRWNEENQKDQAWADKPGIAYGKEAVSAAKNPSGNAGKGGGKPYIIKPAVEKGAKPISKEQVDYAKKVKQIVPSASNMGKGGDGAITKLKKSQDNMLANIKKSERNSMRTSSNGSDGQSMHMCMDAMISVLQELKSINANTAVTAKNTADIAIVSANAPISSAGNGKTAPAKTSNSSNGLRNPNSDTGYDVARSIAAFSTK